MTKTLQSPIEPRQRSPSPPLRPRALLVNPWITDVAAYDLWARPLGLLYLAALLRQRGWSVGLLDCMDRRHPSLGAEAGRDDGCGRGKYRSEIIGGMDGLKGEKGEKGGKSEKGPTYPTDLTGLTGPTGLNRPYRRYGISLEAFDRDAAAFAQSGGPLAATGPPDLILVTSRMTYWYPGVQMAIDRLRRLFPRVPIALGGVYATLCPDHARRHSGADMIIGGEGENPVLALAESVTPGRFDASPIDPDRLDDLPAPAWVLAHHRDAPAVLASRGCPMNCSYCGSSLLYRSHRRRDPGRVVEEILCCVRDFGAADVAFYDDALLARRSESFEPILDALIAAGSPVRLHTPNGVHASFIDGALAAKMRAARVETLRLSLETADAAHLARLNRPAGAAQFSTAMAALRKAGFSRSQLGVYLLAAMPGQSEEETRRSIDLAIECEGAPLIGEYSPIPGTPQYARARDESGLALDDEPLLHNNSVFHTLAPWSRDGLIARLRQYARDRLRQVRVRNV